MRATHVTVAALAAALLLTACDDNGGDDSATKKTGDACVLDSLGVDVAASAAPSAGDTGNVTVTLTNRDTKCTLKGFPGVDLYAGNVSTTVPTDKAATPAKLTLAKDATASFTITYTRGEAGGKESLPVKTVKFTLPGATADHSFTWSYGEVAIKGAGNAPNASVTPLTQAGD
ncbi:DUF4232 domain-containing protein [Streptomyces sp. NPDC047081]|uniref:DUF4232 domain-containing protein n=1 Tax=Streptomyces sp. NPDC047081 TaxID=3154706 RepID=UPI0033F48047